MRSVGQITEHRFGLRRLPHAVVQWLLLIAATFVAGCLAIALLPGYQATVVKIGVWGNVAMAIGMGLVLAWKRLPERLCCAAWLGAVVTVIGWDFLSFTVEEVHGEGGLGAIPFDVVALPVAALGMLILVGVGAALGGIGRMLCARCPYGRRLPRLDSFFP